MPSGLEISFRETQIKGASRTTSRGKRSDAMRYEWAQGRAHPLAKEGDAQVPLRLVRDDILDNFFDETCFMQRFLRPTLTSECETSLVSLA